MYKIMFYSIYNGTIKKTIVDWNTTSLWQWVQAGRL